MIWLMMILLSVAAVWCLFIVGVLHSVWADTLRRERKRGGIWVPGKSGSPTSNSRPMYEMTIRRLEVKGTRIIASGTLKGCMPHRNEAAYLETDGERIPVVILSLRQEDMPDAESGVRICMKLFGAPRAFRARLSAPEPQTTPCDAKGRVTNLRQTVVSKAAAPQSSAAGPYVSDRSATGKPTNHDSAPSEKNLPEPVELHYPIIVKTSLREIIPAASITLLAFCCFAIGICGIIMANEETDGLVVMVVIGLLVGLLGLYWLIGLLNFRLTITENQITIRKYYHTMVTHIDNLHSRTHLATDSSEKWIMDISNAAGGQIASINNTYPHYAEALEAFSRAVKRQNEEKRRSALRHYLSETDFLILGFTIETGNEKIVMPRMMTRKDSGAQTLFLFDNEAQAHENFPDAPLIPAKLVDALNIQKQMNMDVLALWSPANGMKPLEITSELLKSLQIE